MAQGYVCGHEDSNRLICGYMDENKKVWYLPRNAVVGMVLSGWVFAGLSCTLIKRRVFEAGIRFRLEPGIGEDILFLYDVQSKGFIAKVHGGVECGHLPEWPLTMGIQKHACRNFKILDVGCGHQPKGDVNVDLFPGPTAHRSADQRIYDDVALDIRSIPNFVQADACHLPFVDGAVDEVFSSHVIEHVDEPELMLSEIVRVAYRKIELYCPNGEHPSAFGESKPLHKSRFHLSWFKHQLELAGLKNFDVHYGYSQGEPWEIVVQGEKT